ncbi:hypothetical protein ECC02_010253 [Trypanosoma cruzi]|uniref:Uncharacterized protein n=1 Tax=Trypanosoma cruzi TaxID=5693 RepID=A0A7J6XR65_TRYCR|nr:hypothetical protein ECC02_010253 [Trypanosoma cruzi]
MSSEHHSDTPRHAKQKYSSLQCTSPHNHIVHAPRTAAAHSRSNKFSSNQCYPRAAVGSKQKRRAAKPQKSATTGRKSTERSHSNEFSPDALNLPLSPRKDPITANQIPCPLNFALKHQKKPQCLMLSSQSVDDAWMRMGTHRSSQTTPHTRDASCTLGHASLTITRDAHAPSVRNKSSRNEGYVRLTARHPPTNHIAGIINNSSSRSQKQQSNIDQLTHGVCQRKKLGGVTRVQENDTLSTREKQYKNTQRQFRRPQSKQATDKKA